MGIEGKWSKMIWAGRAITSAVSPCQLILSETRLGCPKNCDICMRAHRHRLAFNGIKRESMAAGESSAAMVNWLASPAFIRIALSLHLDNLDSTPSFNRRTPTSPTWRPSLNFGVPWLGRHRARIWKYKTFRSTALTTGPRDYLLMRVNGWWSS
jgi:hypothetical protein